MSPKNRAWIALRKDFVCLEKGLEVGRKSAENDAIGPKCYVLIKTLIKFQLKRRGRRNYIAKLRCRGIGLTDAVRASRVQNRPITDTMIVTKGTLRYLDL